MTNYSSNGDTRLTGTVTRIVTANATGFLSAPIEIIVGELSNATVISLLIDNANWTSGIYTGTAITGTFAGMYYWTSSYKYEASSDNVWRRIKADV